MSPVSSFVFLAAFLCAMAKPDESCIATFGSAPGEHIQAWSESQDLQAMDQSLLALRSAASTGIFAEEVREHMAEYQTWSAQHQKALHEVEKSKGMFDRLMADRSTANNPCTSSLLDLMHGVSSLTHDLQSVSEQAGTHVQTLQLQTGKLNSTMMELESIDQEYVQGVSLCTSERSRALEDLSRYKAQLQELKEIAKPSSPYTHTGNVEWPPIAPWPLQDGLWSKDRCQAFLDFAKQHHEHFPQGVNKTDCDADREQLHKTCSDMYVSLRALAKTVKAQSEDKTCVQSLRQTKHERLIPLISQRDQEVALIKLGSTKLNALQPVLAHLNDRVNKIDAGVSESARNHCDASEIAIVPEVLARIHELIHSLQECPSQNDVVDNLPEVEKPQHMVYTVCADDNCGTDEPLHAGHLNDTISNNSGVARIQAIMSWGGELEH